MAEFRNKQNRIVRKEVIMLQLTSNLQSLVATAVIVFFLGLFALLKAFISSQEMKHKMFKPVFYGWPILLCFIILLIGYVEGNQSKDTLLDFYENDPNIKETQYIMDEVYTNEEIVIDHKYYRNCSFSNSILTFQGVGSSYHYGSIFDNVTINSKTIADLKIRKSKKVIKNEPITESSTQTR